jgi:RHS repeat-associated protein
MAEVAGVTVQGYTAGAILPAAVLSATYNANNQLTQWGSTAMTYDLNGNTLNDGTNAYVWDARNRLVSANSNAASFSYDAFGRRASKSFLSTTTGFLYDGPNSVQERQGATVTANLLTAGLDERFQRTDTSGSYSYLTDVLGSTMALTDSTGAQQTTYSYGPFGVLSATGSNTNDYTYTGREVDGLGIDYFRARYYNPQTGRFISEDPIGLAGGINEYVYVADNPALFTDRKGTSLCPIHYWETVIAYFNVFGFGNAAGAAAAGFADCAEDIGTQGTSFRDTRRHAMGGRKDNGNEQTPCQAYQSTANFVNSTDDPMAAVHAIQDSYASGHQYQPWNGGFPSPSHILGDSVYLPAAEAATEEYLQDLENNDLQDASAYLSPSPCSD